MDRKHEYNGPDELAIGNLMSQRYANLGGQVFWGTLAATGAEVFNKNKEYIKAVMEFADKGIVTGAHIYNQTKDLRVAAAISIVAPIVGQFVGEKQARDSRETFYEMKEEITTLQAEKKDLQSMVHQGKMQIKEIEKEI